MTKRPIKVLHVIHWPVSGIVSLFKSIISLMPQDEVESHVIFFNNESDTISEFSKICSSTHCLNLSTSYVRGIFQYYQLLKQISPDILHTHSFQPMIWGSLFCFGKNKHISTIHNDYPYFRERNIRAFLKRSLQNFFLKAFGIKVVSVSRRVLSILSEMGIPSRNLYMIENGIPLTGCPAVLSIEEVRRELMAEREVLLVTLGRLDITQKGYDILLMAFQEVCKIYKDIILVFVGDGPDKAKLIDMADKLGVIGQVRFAGFKKNPLPYLKAADIYVSSSIFEGFALAVAEAMLQERPIIATRVGAVPEMIVDGISGLLVEPGNHDAITRAIEDLLSQRYDLRLMGSNARESIIHKYDIHKTVNSYLNLYKTCVRNS